MWVKVVVQVGAAEIVRFVVFGVEGADMLTSKLNLELVGRPDRRSMTEDNLVGTLTSIDKAKANEFVTDSGRVCGDDLE